LAAGCARVHCLPLLEEIFLHIEEVTALSRNSLFPSVRQRLLVVVASFCQVAAQILHAAGAFSTASQYYFGVTSCSPDG